MTISTPAFLACSKIFRPLFREVDFKAVTSAEEKPGKAFKDSTDAE